MPYPVSVTEFRTFPHSAVNAADRVCLATLGFTGERGNAFALALLETLAVSETRVQSGVRKLGEMLAFADVSAAIPSGTSSAALTLVTTAAHGDSTARTAFGDNIRRGGGKG